MKYAVYYDPAGRAAPEFELYDLESDRNESRNLVDARSGEPSSPGLTAARDELAERLRGAMAECATLPGNTRLKVAA